MAFTPPTETYTGKICSPKFGVGDTTLTFGGENVLPFHAFEGSVPNRPVIAHEIQDIPPADWPELFKDHMQVFPMTRLSGQSSARIP